MHSRGSLVFTLEKSWVSWLDIEILDLFLVQIFIKAYAFPIVQKPCWVLIFFSFSTWIYFNSQDNDCKRKQILSVVLSLGDIWYVSCKFDAITICIYSFRQATCYTTTMLLVADFFLYCQKFSNLDIMG